MSSLQYHEVVFFFLSLTELTSFLLSFVLWSFKVLGKDSMDYGIRTTKSLSLGMPRMASPLSSSFIVNLTWSYIFIHHMICVMLGASFYFISIFLLLFRIMFCIFSFNKKVKDSLCHAYFASIHVAVWNQKVYRCCKNSLEKSENDIMLNLFHNELW